MENQPQIHNKGYVSPLEQLFFEIPLFLLTFILPSYAAEWKERAERTRLNPSDLYSDEKIESMKK